MAADAGSTDAGKLVNQIERWRRGARGEKATAKALRRLAADGWILFNDIDAGRGNLDHVLLGPAGVFLLESTRFQGVLSVRGGGVLSDGYETRALTRRMRGLARAVETHLRAHDVDGVRVQPVVVLWSAFEQRSMLSEGVAWVQGEHLARTLQNCPAQLSAGKIERAAAALAKTGAPQR